MVRFVRLCFGMLVRLFFRRQSLLLENLALRQQLVRGPRKAVILASRGKAQASIVPRGQREKQDVPAHKGYRK
jgi:hypothetical protein